MSVYELGFEDKPNYQYVNISGGSQALWFRLMTVVLIYNGNYYYLLKYITYTNMLIVKIMSENMPQLLSIPPSLI